MMCVILMYIRRFGDRTAFIEQLLRDEWDRRGGDESLLKFKDKALAASLGGEPRTEKNVNYRRKPKPLAPHTGKTPPTGTERKLKQFPGD